MGESLVNTYKVLSLHDSTIMSSGAGLWEWLNTTYMDCTLHQQLTESTQTKNELESNAS